MDGYTQIDNQYLQQVIGKNNLEQIFLSNDGVNIIDSGYVGFSDGEDATNVVYDGGKFLHRGQTGNTYYNYAHIVKKPVGGRRSKRSRKHRKSRRAKKTRRHRR
jgi:hypothetical protein